MPALTPELITSAVIIGSTQWFKIYSILESKFLPPIAVIIGGIVYPATLGEFSFYNIVFGVLIGFVETGLINFTDNRIGKFNDYEVFEEEEIIEE